MPSVGEMLSEAKVRHSAGDLAGAQKCYERVLEVEPAHAEALYLLGEACQASGRLSEAVAALERAVRVRPEFAEAYNALGIAWGRQSDMTQAVACFRKAVELKPAYLQACYNLAAAMAAQDKLAEAAALWRRVLQLKPDLAEAHNQLGLVLAKQCQWAEAASSYRRAFELKPGLVEAYSNLATLAIQRGQLDEAAACLRRALELRADFAEAHNNLGVVRQRQEAWDEAAACYRRALELKPGFAEAHKNLGAVLAKQKAFDEAAACCRRALELRSDLVDAHTTLGSILIEQGHMAAAAACYRRAVELKPEFAEAHNDLAGVLAAQEKLDKAVASYRRAIELKPDFADAYNNLGAVLGRQEKPSEAEACYRRALELKPDFEAASSNLGSLLAAQGRFEEAKGCLLEALEFQPAQDARRLNIVSLCPSVFDDNQQIDAHRRDLLDELAGFSDCGATFDLAVLAQTACRPSFNLQFHGRNERPIREAYARLLGGCFQNETPRGSGQSRPRIGLVVTESHENIFLRSMGGVLERIRPELFELVLIGTERGVGMLSAVIGNQAIRPLPVANRLDLFVEAIRAARLDVLYYWEIGTDNTNYFLPFYRLAPVQCTSWGIQVTSGIPQVDYYLSSGLVEPEDAAEHYSEQLVLARTLLTYQRRATLPPSPKRRDYFGLAPDKHVYLCAQQLGKFQPDFDPILAGILRADDRGVVVITENRNGGAIAERLRQRFASNMPDVAGRIVFLPFQATPDYLSLVAVADVLLDPLHFGGVNTTYDGFSLGKPIVTLPSRFHRGRYTMGCYKKMGLSECIASDADDYIRIAVSLGTDAQRRAEVAERIGRDSPVLFEDREAVSEHERLFAALAEAARSRRDAS